MMLYFNRQHIQGLVLFACMASATIACQTNTPPTLFKLLPPAETGIEFINHVQDQDSFNIIQYLYYYNGGGVAIGDINQDGLPDIFFTANRETNRLYLNKGKLQFEDVTEEAGVGGIGNWSTGVSMIDINADGWLDIYVCQVGNYKGFQGKNQLFINQGITKQKHDSGKPHASAPIFIEAAADYGLAHEGFSTQAAFLDYDLDGDLDMYLLCHSVHSTETYRDTSATRKRDERAGDKLFRNDGPPAQGGAGFIEVSEEAGIIGGIAGYGLGIAIGDIDKNGCPDIYVGNDFHENDFLYLNNCDGTFSESSTKSLGHTSNFSMGNDLADVNNDGWLDIVTMDMKPADEVLFKKAENPDPYDIYQFKRSFGYHHQFPRNMLHINKGKLSGGQLKFSEIGQMAGMAATDWSWSALLADFDNDGFKDLHISNGIVRRPNNLDYINYLANKEIQENATDLELASQMPDGKISNYIFAHKGKLIFEDRSHDWGLFRPSLSNGAAYGDLDLDGDLDLVVNNINEAAFIYENQARQLLPNHYLSIQLKGPAQNPFGIGAKLSVFYKGGQQFQEMYQVRGWQSSVDHRLHIGLGQVDLIDSLLIEWGDGKQETQKAIAVDQALILDYLKARFKSPKQVEKISPTLFSHLPEAQTIAYKHQENPFYDNKRESLIPYLISTQGPRIAVGDVNADQLEDVFIGGASQQAGSLFIQLADGSFQEQKQVVFQQDALQEDIGLALFDADGDLDLDLYVASGGNQFYHKNEALRDRLYLNDGKGNFSKSENALPVFFNQSSCVEVADYDQDGDMDLFVGSRSIPVNYGLFPDSYLLINNGKGHFSLADQASINLNKLGMVSDAVWTDFDGDSDLDLVVVGEWMPIKLFENQAGKFINSPNSQTLNAHAGWWRTIQTGDFDQDGDEDWIVGNFGLNSNLQPSLEEPLHLYVRDFDANLSKDPILSYFRQQVEYPYASLNELGAQLVFLKKKFRKYDRFANSSILEVFGEEALQKAIKLSANFFHSAFVRNQGNGHFSFEKLPLAAQEAPIQSILIEDFDQDGHLDALLGGNFFDLQPSIGRLDADYGTFLKGLGNGSFEVIENKQSGLLFEGQIRDLQLIHIGQQSLVLVAPNNERLQMYTLTQKP